MMIDVNLLAVLIAAVAAMAIGFVWYSPKLGFGKMWMALNGMSPDTPAPEGQSKLMVAGLLAQVVMAYVLAHFIALTGATDLGNATELAFWVWLGFVATIQLGSVLWDQKPVKLWILNSAYWLVTLVVMAGILVLI